MGWLPCCCENPCPYGGPPDCQAKPNGRVSWFTHEVDGDTGEITRVDHSGRCYTVYVNSVSGDVDETGNGTEARPFVNLNSIFQSSITKSGASGTLASGVFTPGSAPMGWNTGRLIGAKLTLNGTDYEVTANTTTTATIDEPPDDDTYSWALKIFDATCIYNICTHANPPDNCPKVKVLVKGTIDYELEGDYFFGYHFNLVIEPWGEGPITIAVTKSGTTVVILGSGIAGVCWKYVNGTANQTATGVGKHAQVFAYANRYDYCNAAASSSGGYAYCFIGGGPCDYCTATAQTDVTISGYGLNVAVGFMGSTTWRHCTATATVEAVGNGWAGHYYQTKAQAFLIVDSPGAALQDCVGTASITSTGNLINVAESTALNVFSYSILRDCLGTGNANIETGRGVVCGFYSGNKSQFLRCAGEGNNLALVVSSLTVAGFHSNEFCYMDTCKGVGTTNAASGCRFACGFYDNNCCAFVDCTTSDPICIDCGDPCPYECDEFDNGVTWHEETLEGVLTLEPEHSIGPELETIEGVLALEPEHSLGPTLETLQAVLTLSITHAFEP